MKNLRRVRLLAYLILSTTLLLNLTSSSSLLAMASHAPPAANLENTPADHTPDPTSVTIAGSFQSELGCSGDWQPDCANTYLTYDSDDDVWQEVFSLPAGTWEYKAALNNSWAENYGANAHPNGPNIPLSLGAPTDVKFYYDHKSHWVTDNVNSVIVTVAASFQDEIGCPGDWQPDCLRSWLQDPDGDGTYAFSTSDISPGNYEFKVALYEGWNTSYPESNVSFPVYHLGDLVTVTYDSGDDSVAFTVWHPPLPPSVPVDIKPETCPNPLNVKGKGVLSVAIVGTSDFDVTQVDPASVTLEGVSPLRWSWEDSAIPYEPYLGKEDAYDCLEYYPDDYGVFDGVPDLTLKFKTRELVAALGEVNDGDVLVLELTGYLQEEYGSGPFVGEDVVVIRNKGK